MNGPQHYAEADAALRRLDVLTADEIQAEMAIAQVHATFALTAAIIDAHDVLTADEIQAEMAIAQVHATLALTAAIIDAHDKSADVLDRHLLRQWRDVNDGDGFRTVPITGWARVIEK